MSELKALSVTEISNYFKKIFEMEEMLYNISVYGEVTGFSIARGTAYFSIKDENALMSCVYFGYDESQNISNGSQVILRGTPRYYVKGGKLNFNVTSIEPYGVGELYKKFLQLKEKLEKQGLFDLSHKKVIPKTIKRIGVVSSETGAVIQDIRNVTTRRNPSVDIVLYPVKVQGTGAEKEVISGIKFFENYDVDVIIVARGGGSFEDLMPFNDEELAKCVYSCKKPIISAVGHETDFTIIDFVSDLRASTPSAGAELAVEDIFERKNRFIKLFKSMVGEVSSIYINKKNQLLFTYSDFVRLTNDRIGQKQEEVKYVKTTLLNQMQNYYNEKNYQLAICQKNLEKYNPVQILKQGYAKLEQENYPVKSVKEIDITKQLNIFISDGKVVANAISVEEKK